MLEISISVVISILSIISVDDIGSYIEKFEVIIKLELIVVEIIGIEIAMRALSCHQIIGRSKRMGMMVITVINIFIFSIC